MKTLTYLHDCNSGDLICALAGIREAYRKFGKKAIICQKINVPGHYMPGLIHSVKDDNGVQVTFNRKMFDMMRPLLLAQEYIEDFQVYTDQAIDIDLTIIRESVLCDDDHPEKPPKVIAAKQFVNIPNMALPGWTMLAYPPMACDISKPWIEVAKWPTVPGFNPPFPEEMILINRTERYRNEKINYGCLKAHAKDLVFTGTENEYRKFASDSGLDIPILEVDNFLELAQAFRACRFFIGNQSMPWNLANAMGIPRILEMYSRAPNCQPFVGEHNYGFLHQVPLEYYFDLLLNKKAAPEETAV